MTSSRFKANDTDVVVTALSLFPTLKMFGLGQLWMTFGQGHSLRCINVHAMCHYMDQEKIKCILLFRAFTGWDTASAFHNKGKTWGICPEASPVFSKLSQYPRKVEMMYDRSNTAAIVDEARLDMFARKHRPYKVIPPTGAALLQHTRRAAYQAGCVWAQAPQCQQEVENHVNWGWQLLGKEWQVCWATNSHCSKMPTTDHFF